jgi:8-oxo-dGTP pyrophosphatase MutT (NUDIX family)
MLPDTLDTDSLKSRLLSVDKVLEQKDESPPLAAVSIIIDPRKAAGSILLIRRTVREGDPWSGQVAFPGGHRTPQDATFLDTAIREAREEVGIDLRHHEMLGVLPLVFAHSRRVRVAPFVFRLTKPVTVQSNREVAASFWAPLSELARANVTTSEVQVLEGKLTTDSYVYMGNVVWGLTFRIINLLLGR